jgi:hypothetical protein
MKKVLTILAFTLLPFLTMGQASNEDAKNNDIIIENTLGTKNLKQETAASSAMKTQVLKINRKKSTEIISIKAYRKSLQIKVKTVKIC